MFNNILRPLIVGMAADRTCGHVLSTTERPGKIPISTLLQSRAQSHPGILKKSFHSSPPQLAPLTPISTQLNSPTPLTRPDVGRRKEVTLQNTLHNSGHPYLARLGHSPRQSSSHSSSVSSCGDSNTQMKSNKAYHYLPGQEESSTINVEVPKTRCAKYCNLAIDEGLLTLDAKNIIVDELDIVRAGKVVR